MVWLATGWTPARSVRKADAAVMASMVSTVESMGVLTAAPMAVRQVGLKPGGVVVTELRTVVQTVARRVAFSRDLRLRRGSEQVACIMMVGQGRPIHWRLVVSGAIPLPTDGTRACMRSP